MNKLKAVVLEKSGSRYTVLSKDGTFRQVHRRLSAEVGEEIEIRAGIDVLSGLRVWAGVAAIFLVVFTTILGWTLYQAPTAVALLSVDINPSLQFAVDAQGHLLQVQTQNEDAKRMLSQIDLKGKSIDEVLAQIVTSAYDQKFLSSQQQWVVIGYSPMPNKTQGQMPKELNENQIISWVTKIGQEKGLTPQVAVFSLTSQERELAQKGDLTLGEYALWQTATKAGVVTQPEKLKDTSERGKLLENPQIQAQIKSEKQGLETGLPQTPGTVKRDPAPIAKPPTAPVTVPKNPAIDKSKEQDRNKTMENDNAKDLGQADTKSQNEAKSSAEKENVLVKEQNNVYAPILAPIPTPENSKQHASHIYKIPERMDEGENSNKSGGENNNNGN